MKVFVLVMGLLSLFSPGRGLGNEISLHSGNTQALLIELYTSEGCSSCPPAERFLNAFTRDDELWSRYIPVAFHVDYWDDLGWKDRFSSQQYSQRQRRYAQIKRQRTVYTPAFMVNGQNWRPGFYNRSISVPDRPAGELSLTMNEQALRAKFTGPEAASRALELNIALLGMGIESRISAGENSGKKARHEFVVLSHRKYAAQQARWLLDLPRYAGKEVSTFAIAAWISMPGDPTPLQAVGGAVPSAWVH